jgi:hypothetical protein
MLRRSFARGPRTNNQQPTSTRIGFASSAHRDEAAASIRPCRPTAFWADDAMFTRQHGTCAICLRMVSETLCLDHCPAAAAAPHFICDECEAWHRSYPNDPDVARLLAGHRDRRRGEDAW